VPKKLSATERVRRYLAAQDMTQAALAAKVGISGPCLSQILSAKQRPSLMVAAKLQDITGISARDFAGVA